MADITLKKIEGILNKKLDEKLEPIHKKLDEHTEKFDEHDQQFRSISTKLDEHTVKLDNHDKTFNSINQRLGEVNQKLDSLTLDMIDVQKKTDILPDLYSIIKGTKETVDDHEERIQNLENAA